LIVDAPVTKGGGARGLGPHELLEGAIAACINMAVRMCAATHQLPLRSVSASVRIVRPDPQTTRFEYSVEMDGDLDEVQRATLLEAAAVCPVRATLSRTLEFRASPESGFSQ
ncbi:MAG: OsmC family protein, partial [Steroidobacteraceae bacterium]